MTSMAYFVVAGVLLAQSAVAPTPSPEAPPASPSAAAVASSAPKAPDGDTIVCKTIENTGTRFPTRQCATKDQWAERTRQAREFVDANTRLGHCPNNMC